LRASAGGAVQVVAGAPAPGTVWVDARLLDALQLKLGDPLLLGDARLTASPASSSSSPTAARAFPASRRG
jgi:predicted lysophospholipase L1 biosynthesis ABC-type transport system permease subunit